MSRPFDDLIDFIVTHIPHERFLAFQSSEAAREELTDLVSRQKDGTITSDEVVDLNRTLFLIEVVSIAKARVLPDAE